MNVEYLNLPKIPEELIVDIYQTIRNTEPKQRHSVPKETDAEKNAAWNSIKASTKLKEFTKSIDRKSTRLNSSHSQQSRMPSSA